MKIFVPKNPIEVAQEMQWGIDMSSPEEAPVLARQALDVLGDVRTIYDSKRLIIHTLGAYILDRGRTMDEMFEQRFDDVRIKGHFAGIFYLQGFGELGLQSLVVDLFDVQFLQPGIADDPYNGKIRAPLTIPVNDIQSVMVAA